jgi:HEPN domain-containing protein
MDNKTVAKEWFIIAQANLASADFLQNMKPAPLEIICYHCQQSAEKYLRGYLAHHGDNITDMELALKDADEVKLFVSIRTSQFIA